jgi:single-stranded-DNA-specific exonuclease
VLAEAERARGELPSGLGDAAGLVIAGAGWHPGVIGIVASRLVDRHHRPVVLIGLDAEGRGRGSGRSVPGFDLLGALDACARHLLRHGGHRAAAGLEIEAGRIDAFRAAFAERVEATLPAEARVRRESVDAVVGGESLGLDVAEQLTGLAPFGSGNPGVRLLVAGASLGDVRPMGEANRHARFSLRSGNRRARGVAFGANGELDRAVGAGPLDVSVTLELNEWNGALEARVVLGEIYAGEADPVPGTDSAPGSADPSELIGDTEFWRRHDTELWSDLVWLPPTAASGVREPIDRRGASGVATIAALASSGKAVLAVCADAIRRRALVERAARPARFGGGEVAIVSARLPEALGAAAAARVEAEGAGVVLADWGALGRDPALTDRFEHLVIVDPAPFADLDELCRAGEGYLHRVDGPREAEFTLRVHADEWPSRASLATLYRSLRSRAQLGAGLTPGLTRSLLCGEGRSHPLSPEAAARSARVLAELGLVRWQRSGGVRALGVVSSEGTDLERSAAFVAYRARYEEGRRYLSKRRQRPG